MGGSGAAVAGHLEVGGIFWFGLGEEADGGVGGDFVVAA